MHKHHFAGCALVLIVALTVVLFTGASAGSIGILAVALVCPIAMVIAMWFLAGGAKRATTGGEATSADRIR
jgi:Na+/melibiose symporter-like transporter